MNDYTGFFFPVSNSFERTCKDMQGYHPVCRVWQISTRSLPCKAVFRPLLVIYCLNNLARARSIFCRLGCHACLLTKQDNNFCTAEFAWKFPSSEGNASVLLYQHDSCKVSRKPANIWIHYFQISNIHLIYTPKFCISIVFNFSWDDCDTHKKLKP